MFVRENFRLFDFTRMLSNANDFDDLESQVPDFISTDIRCMRKSEDPLSSHSFVLIGMTSPDSLQDISVKILYSTEGFQINIDKADSAQGAEFFHIEKIHLPRAEHVADGGLREIIRWTYEHKDEMYADPWKTPELNMGTRLFEYVKRLIKWLFI